MLWNYFNIDYKELAEQSYQDQIVDNIRKDYRQSPCGVDCVQVSHFFQPQSSALAKMKYFYFCVVIIHVVF